MFRRTYYCAKLRIGGSPLDSIIEPNSNSAEGNAMSLEVADVTEGAATMPPITGLL